MPRKDSLAAIKLENEKLRAQIALLREGGESERVEAPMVRSIDKPQLSGTVTVACKIPIGLQLQLQKKQTVRVPTGHGAGKDAYALDDQWVKYGKVYHVFGPAVPAMGGVPDGYILPQQIEGGYALTHGIPAAFWAEWVEQNAQAEYVLNKMIFAYDAASARDAAREHADLTSGIEPLSRQTDKDGRMLERRIPKSMSGSVSRLARDYDREKERAGGQAVE
jgi:hypothetical protein